MSDKKRGPWWHILNLVALAVIAGYVAVALIYTSNEIEATECRKINITITDSTQMSYITRGAVGQWFAEDTITLLGQKANTLNIYELEKYINAKPFVSDVDVFANMHGDVNITISQRRPIARFLTTQGYNFYIDNSYHVLPPNKNYTESVPLITGSVTLPFEKDFFGEIVDNYLYENDNFLYKLINFVEIVNSDNFLNSLIAQINVAENGDLELVPRVGETLILFGTLDNIDSKLQKLSTFYNKSYGDMWWERYKFLNLQFENQVVCSN